MDEQDCRTPVLVDLVGAVAHVRMNRPKVLNVLDESLAEALASAFGTVLADPQTRAVVLSGAGRSFMAGGDLRRFHGDLAEAPRTAAQLIDRFHTIIDMIASSPKVVVAAVQGPVAGGGVGLALACDLVVAADDTTFLSAYTKIGTTPDGGTTWSLTRLLGPKRALEFILLNERLVAGDAHRLGLVNRVVTGDTLLSEALALAGRLAAHAVGANAGVKRLVRSATMASLEDVLPLEKDSFVDRAGTSDFREGISAFFERRSPRFG